MITFVYCNFVFKVNRLEEFALQAYEAYGAFGIALIAIMLALFGVQIYYYLRIYASLPKYKNDIKPQTGPSSPGISVIVPMEDDFLYIDETLPLMLTQNYDNYEVVIVYLGNNQEFAETLEMLSEAHPKLSTTRIKQHPLFPISNKMALNVGIKAAKYDYVVITTPDTRPLSSRWIPLMAKGFSKGEIVLSYCGIEETKGLANKIIRNSQLMCGTRLLSSAVKGMPYRGMLQNLGFAKHLYFENRGFGFLNMNIGEEDLFMQRIFSPDNVSIVMHPRATVRRKCWGGVGWWYKERKTRTHAYKYYPIRIKNFVEWEIGSRALFFLTALAALLFLPPELKIIAVLLLAARFAVVVRCMKRISKRLGETGLTGAYFIYDILSPMADLAISVSHRFRPDKEVWR